MSEQEPRGNETGSGRLALIFWTSAAMLLGYLALLQLGTMIDFMTSRARAAALVSLRRLMGRLYRRFGDWSIPLQTLTDPYRIIKCIL